MKESNVMESYKIKLNEGFIMFMILKTTPYYIVNITHKTKTEGIKRKEFLLSPSNKRSFVTSLKNKSNIIKQI